MNNIPQPFVSNLPAGPRRQVAHAKHTHDVLTWAANNGGYQALLAYHRQYLPHRQAQRIASFEWRAIKRHGLPARPLWRAGDMVYGVAFPDSGSGQPFWPLFSRDSSLEAAVIADNLA